MTGGGGTIQVVQVRGELDLALADSLAVRGYAAIGRQTRVLLLDVAGVSFCDACGLSALVRIANHADRTGCRYGLIAPQPLVVKILRITGLDQRLPVFTSFNEAAIVLGYDPQTALEEPDDQWVNHIPAGHTATPGTAPRAPQRRQRAPPWSSDLPRQSLGAYRKHGNKAGPIAATEVRCYPVWVMTHRLSQPTLRGNDPGDRTAPPRRKGADMPLMRDRTGRPGLLGGGRDRRDDRRDDRGDRRDDRQDRRRRGPGLFR